MRGTLLKLIFCLPLVGLVGCSLLLPEISRKPVIRNPFPQLSKVAVAPFFNHSDEPTVNGRDFAMAYFSELQLTPGFEVVPLGVVEEAMIANQINLGGAGEARRLAQILGVDAIVVGAVTEYSPYYPPRCGMHVEWYTANPGYHEIPTGYGLPWNTPEEEYIPESLVYESQMALARAQMATQAPDCDASCQDLPAPPTAFPGQFSASSQNLNGSASRNNQAGSGSRAAGSDSRSSGSGSRPGGSGSRLNFGGNGGSGIQPAPSGSAGGSDSRGAPAGSDSRPPNQGPSPTGNSLRRPPFPAGSASKGNPLRDPFEEDEIQLAQATEELPPIPAAAPSLDGSSAKGSDTKEDASSQSIVASETIVAGEPVGTTGTLPPQWPDENCFVPSSPQATRPPCLPHHGPVLKHTRVYNGTDPDFTQALENYVYFRDDKRFGDWQSYLQRSEDFIRFCCHMHISEMLSARGGSRKTRVVLRWPENR